MGLDVELDQVIFNSCGLLRAYLSVRDQVQGQDLVQVKISGKSL